MAQYIISHSPGLWGETVISTGKNAVLPILAASLLTKDEVFIENVPCLSDVRNMCAVLSSCGAKIKKEKGGLMISSKDVHSPLMQDALRTMRASVLILGPLCARCGEVALSMPGGCAIGQRPIDLHLKGLVKMGGRITHDGGIFKVWGKLHADSVYLDFPSVGATENLVMACAVTQGVSRIENAAKEPEIVDLCQFMNACGARIHGAGTANITVEGVPRLHGCRYTPIPDRIEAGTFACAAAVTDGSIFLRNARLDHMRALIFKLQEMGMMIEEDENGVRLRGRAKHPVEVRTLSYPGFPTDMQSLMMVAALSCDGPSIFHETIFENRFMHVVELNRMGAHIRVEGQLALLEGGFPLKGTTVTATDLRASAALMIAGLYAKGETHLLDEGCHLLRGYDQLETKLCQLGGKVVRTS